MANIFDSAILPLMPLKPGTSGRNQLKDTKEKMKNGPRNCKSKKTKYENIFFI